MKLKVQSNLDLLDQKLEKLSRNALDVGSSVVRITALEMQSYIKDHLEHQGRPGGVGPPLSPVTKLIYKKDGEPDGSGIRDHLKVEYDKSSNGAIAILSLPEGEPSEIMRVQNKGALIEVTVETRAFFSSYGVDIKPTAKHLYVPGRHAWDFGMKHGKHLFVRELSNFFHKVFTTL